MQKYRTEYAQNRLEIIKKCTIQAEHLLLYFTGLDGDIVVLACSVQAAYACRKRDDKFSKCPAQWHYGSGPFIQICSWNIKESTKIFSSRQKLIALCGVF